MTCSRIVVGVVLLLGAQQSYGWKNTFGTPADAAVCEQDFAKVNGNWTTWKHRATDKPGINSEPVFPTNVSAECKAELDKRVKVCLADAEVKEWLKTAREPWKSNPEPSCANDSFQEMRDQFAKAKKDKEEKAAREAEMAKVEMPTATKKNPTIEKQISAAYKEAYPDNKILQVLLQAADWSTERNNLGIITNRYIQAIVVNKQKDGSCQLHNEAWTQDYVGKKFAGKVTQRGAGSQRLTGILCEKVPGAK